MRPGLRSGQALDQELGDPLTLRVGDPVVFWEGRRFVVHRVLARRDHELFVAADRLPVADGWIPLDAVVGWVPQLSFPFGALSVPRACSWRARRLWLHALPVLRRVVDLRRVASAERARASGREYAR